MLHESPDLSVSRRGLLQAGLATGLGYWLGTESAHASSSALNKLNVAAIGVGGRGMENLKAVSTENIVALCDVDDQRAGEAYKAFPHAAKFADYRQLFDKLSNQIDAVVISTPDHTHAVIASAALRLGKHVYCEKPLTHTIHEARVLRDLASQAKVATQMGNQGHSLNEAREIVEIIRSGVLGPITEVHAWSDRPNNWWPQGVARPGQASTPPKTLNWDLWLGPAPYRDYHPDYVPFKWRGRWDFGTGSLGDMACHVIDAPFWGLNLGFPTRVESVSDGATSDSPPVAATITFRFPERDGRPPVTLIWYDGGRQPANQLVGGKTLPRNGSILVGREGTLYIPHPYCGKWELLPEAKFAGYKKPNPSLPRSPGHHREWLDAAKGGPQPLSNFAYGSYLTEVVLLGNIANRLGRAIDWDPMTGIAKDCPEADGLVNPPYRAGWTL